MVRTTKTGLVLDEKDTAIVRMLMENGRTTYREMAEALGISDVAVRKRLARLERSGVILGYTAVVDPKALGFRVVSLTGVDVEPGDLIRLARELASRDYVKAAWITAGDHAIMLEIWARDEEEMEHILKEIEQMRGVTRVCPAVVTETLKTRC